MRIIFEVNDNTGCIQVVFYQKDQGQLPTALRNFTYKQHTYVKVFGSIRIFKESKAIVGTHIRSVERFEEITNHLLQTFVAH
jgi:RPA family protein